MTPNEALPYHIEAEEQILARLPAAFAVVQDLAAIAQGQQLRPGQRREHVFDFPNGVRLIASTDPVTAKQEGEHLSFSLNPAFQGIWTRQTFIAWVSSFCQRAGWKHAPSLTHITPGKGVLHLFFEGQRRRTLTDQTNNTPKQ